MSQDKSVTRNNNTVTDNVADTVTVWVDVLTWILTLIENDVNGVMAFL